MGQRSQIYIRIKDEDGNTTLFAKYLQWNFGERMISRARYGIEYIKRNMEYINQDTVQQRINKIFDINFDMQDVALSTDILQEVRNDFWWDRSSVNDYIFSGQDNNDGKLFIDCDQTSNEIKFCFTDYDLKILTPNKYMKWDIGEEWKSNKFYDEPDLNKEWQEIIPICESNIEYINRNAKMMNELELEQYINEDYSKQIGDSKFKEFLQEFIEKGMLHNDFRYFHIERTDENNSWKFYGQNPEDLYMKYDSSANRLTVEPSFDKEYYEGIIQEVCNYYCLKYEKNLKEFTSLEESFGKETEIKSLEIGEKNDAEIDYDYE